MIWKQMIDDYLEKAGLDIRVIGVIGAGVRGTFETIDPSESCSIGVMATVGTVSSGGYINTIVPYQDYKGPSITNPSAIIDTSILVRYDFDWDGILYSGSRKHPQDIQLNSVDNYIH